MSEWQPIDTAPKDGTTVLLFRRLDPWNVIGYGRWISTKWRLKDGTTPIEGWLSYGFDDPPGNLGLGGPTHWMPLPEPPKEPMNRRSTEG